MSKSISFGFGKSKNSQPATSAPSAPRAISLGISKRPTASSALTKPKSALRDDSDDDDDAPPRAEAVTGFTFAGAVLSKPTESKKERVIANAGNSDWRRRGRTNLLPAEVQAAQEAQQNGNNLITVERNEVSTASGLQFAEASDNTQTPRENGHTQLTEHLRPGRELTEDERALQALLEDGTDRPSSTAVIATQGNIRLNQRDETDDFRTDVAMRPDSSTLEDYAAMPVEEFGMAMLRGMGQKRRANGEIINFDRNDDDKNNSKKTRKQDGFLGIGAKAAPGLEGVELGAWGKADMRKNQKGQGFFTPVMMEDKRTGERITEEEFERRKKSAKSGGSSKSAANREDWRDRRDRNLEQNGRGDGAHDSPRKRDRESDRATGGGSGYDSIPSASRRNRDVNGQGYDSSRSRRDRRDQSRSRDGRRRHDRSSDDSSDDTRDRDSHRRSDHDRDRDRHHDRRDDERYKLSSHRDGDRDRGDKRRNYDDDRDRDRDRDRKRDRDRDRGSHRDRR